MRFLAKSQLLLCLMWRMRPSWMQRVEAVRGRNSFAGSSFRYTLARACQTISAMRQLRLSWVQRRAPSQEPSKRFGVWDPHENSGHRPNNRNPVTSQSEVESDKASEVPLAEVVKRCVVTPRLPVDEAWRWKEDNWLLRVRCNVAFTARLSSRQLRMLRNPFTTTRWMFWWRSSTPRVRVVSLFVSAEEKRKNTSIWYSLLLFGATRAVVSESSTSLVARFMRWQAFMQGTASELLCRFCFWPTCSLVFCSLR